jgi:hypothetical protein
LPRADRLHAAASLPLPIAKQALNRFAQAGSSRQSCSVRRLRIRRVVCPSMGGTPLRPARDPAGRPFPSHPIGADHAGFSVWPCARRIARPTKR